MSWHAIGEIALNLTTLIYFIWFVPQLMLTFKCRRTSSLSLCTHSLLIMGYLTDLIYGYGQHLPLQYKLVNICGLMILAIEHYQFWCYSQWQGNDKRIFQGLTLFFILLFFSGIYQITLVTRGESFYNAVGFFSWFCWLGFMWPQLLKNAANQSTEGLSFLTIILLLTTSAGDIIAAFALEWAWPSQYGSLLGLLPKILLLMQCYYYRNNTSSRVPAHVLPA